MKQLALTSLRETVSRILQRTSLFAPLTAPQLERVLASMLVLELDAEEHLFFEGQRAERFYLVLDGRIKLYRASHEGREKVILLVGPEEIFAEGVMFLETQHYPLNAAALSPVRICAFHNGTFLELLRESTGLCMTLLGDMSMRLHARINEIDALTLKNARLRVLGYLIECLPNRSGDPVTLHLPAAKSVVASWLSVTPETLSRILHDLVREEIIGIKGRDIWVRDPVRLRQAAY